MMGAELMEGVRVLNTIPEVKTMGIGFYLGIGILAWFLISLAAGIVIAGACEIFFIIRASVIVGVIVGTVYGVTYWVIDSAKDMPETYEVIISDGADAREFNERFEVVEKNGEIYRVKEREQ